MTRPAPVHTSSTSGPLATGASPTAAAALVRLQRLAHLLDSKFRLPVLGIRFGLDPILGLIPGLGDALGLAVSGYIVLEAAPRVSGYDPGVTHVSFGIEKRAGGHLFQLNFSNDFATTMGQIARGGFNNDDWYLGFNISRKFF